MAKTRSVIAGLYLGRPRKLLADSYFTPLPRESVSAANIRVGALERTSEPAPVTERSRSSRSS
jgi:hypothetical protein